MMHFTDMTGLASSVVAMAGAAFMVSGVARISKHYRMALAGIVACVVLIPFGGLSLAAYVRGATGDLSITALILMLMTILTPLNGWTHGGNLNASSRWRREGWGVRGKFALLSLIGLAALLLYPMALGWGTFDLYRLGYGDPLLLGALFIVTVFVYFRQLWLPAGIFSLAVLAWAVGWYESTNLWDYLLDPLLASYALGALAKRGVGAPTRLQ